MRTLHITLLAVAMLLVAGAWSISSTPTVASSTAAGSAATLLSYPCPPLGCETAGDQTADGEHGGEYDTINGNIYPKNLWGYGCINSFCGWWTAVHDPSNGEGVYSGAFWGTNGSWVCSASFYMGISAWTAWYIWGGGNANPLTIFVWESNGQCGF